MSVSHFPDMTGLNCNNSRSLPLAGAALINAVDIFIASQTGGFDLTCCPGGFCVSESTRYASTVTPCSDACPILINNVTVGAAACRYNTLVTTPDVCSVTLANDLGPCGLAPPPSPTRRPPPPKPSLLEKKKRSIDHLR